MSCGHYMSSGNMASSLKEFLVCPLCLEEFKDPRALECLHNFCSRCLQEYINSKKILPGQKLDCPVCRHPVVLPRGGMQNIRKNHLIVGLQDAGAKFQASLNTPTCRGCKANAPVVRFCLECAYGICEDCCNIHDRLRNFEQHRVVTFEGLQGGKYSADQKAMASICEEHSMQKDLFCEGTECRKPICMKCKILKHEGHKTSTLLDRAKAERDILADIHSSVVKCQKREETCLKNGKSHKMKIQKSLENMKQELAKNIDQVVQAVQKEGKILMNEIEKVGKLAIENVDVNLKEVESKVDQYKHTGELISELLEQSPNEDLVCLSPQATEQAIHLTQQPASVKDWENWKMPQLRKGKIERQQLTKMIGHLQTCMECQSQPKTSLCAENREITCMSKTEDINSKPLQDTIFVKDLSLWFILSGALRRFFEDTGSSGGGAVENLWYQHFEGIAVIQFQDPSVVERVMSREQICEGKHLTVEIYDKNRLPFPPNMETFYQ